MGVRRAVVDDVPSIAKTQVESWEGVYRGLVPDEIFDVVNLEFRVRVLSNYFVNRPARTSLLVNDSDGVIGMSWFGPCRDDDFDSAEVAELLAIYVKPTHWDKGHGRDLMVASLAAMRDMKFTSAALWVLDANKRARDFYEAGGWTADGHSKIDDSFGVPISEVRYVTRL